MLGAKVQTLIVRIESLTLLDPTLSPLLAGLQESGGSLPTVRLLVAKVALLDRLLVRLMSVDPVAAQRLAAALPALHALVANLLFAASYAQGSSIPATLIGPPMAIRMLAPLIAPYGAGFDSALAGVAPALSEASASGQSFVGASSAVVGRPAIGTTGIGRVSRSAPAPTVPPPLPSPLGGGVGSASGGLGLGMAAATGLLLLAIVCRPGMVLCRRFELDRMGWRAMFLAPRLERPG